MTATDASLELTKQLAQDLRELRGKVESIDDKVDELRGALHTHRLTGNGEAVEERAVKLPLGLKVRDIVLFVLLGEVVGSNLLELLGVP